MSNPLGQFKRVLFSVERATDAVGFTGMLMSPPASGYGIIVLDIVLDNDSESVIRVGPDVTVTNNQTPVPTTDMTICDADRTINTVINTGIVFPATLQPDPYWKNRRFTGGVNDHVKLPAIFVPPGHHFEVFHTATNAAFDCAIVFDELTAPIS